MTIALAALLSPLAAADPQDEPAATTLEGLDLPLPEQVATPAEDPAEAAPDGVATALDDGDDVQPAFLGALSANDNFAAAVTVATFSFSTTGNNAVDTTQAGEPLTCDSATMGHTVWYKVVPSVSGTLYADTRGSNFDTVLAGYQGTTLSSLTQLACNDDTADLGLQSRIQFSVFAGTTYYVQLGGYATDSGTFFLFIDNFSACSSNDNQANACTVLALPYNDAQNTAGATTEVGELPIGINCPGTPTVSHTVWYRYTVPLSTPTQSLTASTFGSTYDTVLDVFVAGAGRSVVPVACNDDAPGGSHSEVTWIGTAGTTYLIRASGFGASFGNLAFSLS